MPPIARHRPASPAPSSAPGPDPRPLPPAPARARGLVKVHGEGSTAVRALDGVDVDVPAGRMTAVMGPSGSGKSTLLHCLAGLDTPTSGHVWIAGVEIGRMDDEQLTRLRREQLGFVFQAFNLLPTLTARENVLLPSELARAAVDPAWFDHLVGVLGLGDRLQHRPSELSGGQQQRVAMARALVTSPALLVADEPTGNLDSRSGAEVLDLLRGCVTELGQTVVMVTHDPVAASYADRALVLVDGRIRTEIASPTAESVQDALRSAELGRVG